MIRRPPRSTRTDTLFPTRRSSDLSTQAAQVVQAQISSALTFPESKRSVLLSPLSDRPRSVWTRRRGDRAVPAASAGQASSQRPQLVQAVSARRSAGSKRSEEHTSELQSLMRISYDVFCLKKKQQHP